MALQTPPVLLSPRERTAVITRLNKVMHKEGAFTHRNFAPLAVSAYPYIGRETHAVDVVVVVDRPVLLHADMVYGNHDLAEVQLSDRIRMRFLNTAQAAETGFFDFAANILSERVLADPHLEGAVSGMYDPIAVTGAYFCAVQQLYSLGHRTPLAYPADTTNEEAAGRARIATEELELAAAIRCALGTPGGVRFQEEAILSAAAEKFCQIAVGSEPARFAAAATLVRSVDTAVFYGRISEGFRKARIHALHYVPDAHELDAKAAATQVLLSAGGTRPLLPSVRSRLASGVALLPEAPLEAEGEEFLL